MRQILDTGISGRILLRGPRGELESRHGVWRPLFSLLRCGLLLMGVGAAVSTAWAGKAEPAHPSSGVLLAASSGGLDPSTLKDGLHGLDLGIRWLASQQHEDGSWSLPQFPAITGLCVLAFTLDPRVGSASTLPAPALRGVDYILGCVQLDGGLYIPVEGGGGLAHYNTAICLTALLSAGVGESEPVVRRAREFLIAQQHLGNSPYHGGFGYDPTTEKAHADLASTYLALEAIWISEREKASDSSAKLEQAVFDWEAALQFLSRVQNLPGSNPETWAASPRPEDLGGFVYHPGESKAGEETGQDGVKRLHSYGSMSYAGLLSYLYAGLDRDDSRVLAAVDWIRNHYTVEENPGMGAQGLYFNYHTMAKALSRWGERPLILPSGAEANWQEDLVRKLVSLQRIDPSSSLGYWVNDNGRWWENDPVLATAYALMALEMSLGGYQR